MKNKDNKKLIKWVTCGFNFVSAFIGPLASTIKIDCTKNGLFDLDQLKNIPFDNYDGVIYTNTFCQQTEISELVNYCEANNKFIVIDNATGLRDRCVNKQSYIPEIISLHHTKPWGFGEGGAIICDSSDAMLVRKLINFGASKIDPIYSIYSGNKKLSDISASAILSRLATYNQWSKFYLGQEKRIKSIISDYSLPLKPLINNRKTKSPLAYTPFVVENQEITEEIIEKSVNITFRKYYRPFLYGQKINLKKNLPNAYELYSKILCISNNPENSLKSESEILSDLNALLVNKN
ncbi:DegT/DnrJ/EryC1/StrS family aminotransferase [Prochlorococcus sp. AH-736-B04]|nr:DegT/DnrJ/EryC1/StrS family aminotransferase [Prochlorococcus sp. AH-736-B04]